MFPPSTDTAPDALRPPARRGWWRALSRHRQAPHPDTPGVEAPGLGRWGGGWALRLASLAGLVLVWELAALWLGDPLTLPGPARVAGLMLAETLTGDLPRHLLATLLRVVGAFAIAMSLGVALGLWMGRRARADAFLDNLLIVFLNLPALVTIVLCYIWIGLNEAAAISAVAINKIPMVTVMIREGARALDPQIGAMVQSFRPPRHVVLRDVVLPQLAPHIAAAGRAGLALIWKIVLVVEFLGRPDGIGFQIHLGFQLFDVTQILAYALAFVAVMLLIEALVLRPWETRANRWRRT